MNTWQRILRYLILWGILLVVLCVISVIRYWDQLAAIFTGTVSSFFSSLISIGLVVGLLIWGLRLMIRGR